MGASGALDARRRAAAAAVVPAVLRGLKGSLGGVGEAAFRKYPSRFPFRQKEKSIQLESTARCSGFLEHLNLFLASKYSDPSQENDVLSHNFFGTSIISNLTFSPWQ